jgi:hypothetical protein
MATADQLFERKVEMRAVARLCDRGERLACVQDREKLCACEAVQ